MKADLSEFGYADLSASARPHTGTGGAASELHTALLLLTVCRGGGSCERHRPDPGDRRQRWLASS